MKKKLKIGICGILPLVIIVIIIFMLIIFKIQFNVMLFIFIFAAITPYIYAFYREFSVEEDLAEKKLSEYELNLIQENKQIVKTLEIMSLIFSFLFGLFTNLDFQLRLSQNPSAELIGYLSMLFAINFFMATFVFIQTQVLGKDAFLTKKEIEEISIKSPKTRKIENFLKRLHFANLIRKGCYFSLLVQICIFYPFSMINLSL